MIDVPFDFSCVNSRAIVGIGYNLNYIVVVVHVTYQKRSFLGQLTLWGATSLA